jgi:hypothetical protein
MTAFRPGAPSVTAHAVTAGCSLLLGLALGALVLIGQTQLAVATLFALLIAVLVGVTGYLAAGRLLGLGGLVLTALTLPASLSSLIALPGTALTLGDVMLFLGFALCVAGVPTRLKRPIWIVLGAVSIVVIVGVIGTSFAGALSSQWPSEALRVLRLGAAAVVGLAVASHSNKMVVQAAGVVVWQALLAVVASLVFGLQLSGRVAAVDSLADPTGESAGILRFQIPGSQVALAFLACVVALSLLGRRQGTAVRLTTAAATVVTFLNFSRNSVVVVGMSALCALLLFSEPGRLRRGTRVAATALACVVGVLVLTKVVPESAVSRGVESSLSSFTDRVLVGLTPSGRAVDSSVRLRGQETDAAIAAVVRRPLSGFGFGVPYRPPIDFGEFWARSGRTYVHNAYLWFAVKVGLPGLALRLVLLWGTISSAIRNRREFMAASPLGAAALCALLPMCVVSLWVPFLIDPWAGPTMVILGTLIFVPSHDLTEEQAHS